MEDNAIWWRQQSITRFPGENSLVETTDITGNPKPIFCQKELKPLRQGRVESEAEGVVAGQAFRKFLPLFDRVLIERSAAETVTRGGIMFPEKSQGKVLQATVVAVGSGSKGKDGEIQPVSVKVGDKVLFPEDGGTKVVLDDKDYFLFRDGDILGKYVD
ncbi:10 kDa heat shock protein, mitochondrial-like [Cebus imitator]|uniref:10 kDa heat shock protein, mitochondrial-like n=1 Tax=Cebus imitator TaxID=2715852 RepID=UPI00189C5649|nr:10 kDa heat shock protein, mitochondrial-like [Cebus imitator]